MKVLILYIAIAKLLSFSCGDFVNSSDNYNFTAQYTAVFPDYTILAEKCSLATGNGSRSFSALKLNYTEMEALKLQPIRQRELSRSRYHEVDKSVFEFIREYLERSHRPDRYKKMYLNTLDHLVSFTSKSGMKETLTDSIGMEFSENFVHYLRVERGLMQNTVKGHLERMNAMLHKAMLYGYSVDNTYKEVTVEEEEVSAVFLSMTEITRIYYFKGLTRFQDEVRDHFMLGCLTGLRYSDYSRLNESNFDRDSNMIRIKTQKTGVVVSVPMHKFVREILRKYDYDLPKPRCIQYFNRAIKEISKKVGLKETILWERTVGAEVVRKRLEKWEMISSHTARRSFATNMFLQNVPTYRIMLITGHKSESSFFKYIRVTREENASTLQGHLFFQ